MERPSELEVSKNSSVNQMRQAKFERSWVFAFCILAMGVSQCAEEPVVEHTKWVAGIVRDSLSSLPLDSVLVTQRWAAPDTLMYGVSAYTNNDGYYILFVGGGAFGPQGGLLYTKLEYEERFVQIASTFFLYVGDTARLDVSLFLKPN